ncbi:hypothetical protein CYMTET_28447 [Cymbomonas tetramitiformis]|uniref:Uncharacterized protein n=1 Tax=Cymbomonas tetramitiformis TaxID=36881 RepID=A0AAE0FN91_9CHLO|nr:hypothetical protein CYMTET_28447 [Cymbomonas tetramitiformis]
MKIWPAHAHSPVLLADVRTLDFLNTQGENGTQSNTITLDAMLNAQLVKMLRPKTRARTNIGGRKRELEEAKPPSTRTKLPEIESMPTLGETDSPMGTASEISQEYETPTEADTPADTPATPADPRE